MPLGTPGQDLLLRYLREDVLAKPPLLSPGEDALVVLATCAAVF